LLQRCLSASHEAFNLADPWLSCCLEVPQCEQWQQLYQLRDQRATFRVRQHELYLLETQGRSRIVDAFASLSGMEFKPLEPRFAEIKRQLIAGKGDALHRSWIRLLASLREEIPLIAKLGSRVVPVIDFKDIDNASPEFRAEHKKRGVAVIRNVIPRQEALDLKQELREYIAANPHTKAFPKDSPQVFELYWSPAQIKARSHSNMIKAQRFLMEFWHSKDPNALISSSHPLIYADRLRMR